MTARSALLVALLISGCAAGRAPAPARLDAYAGRGPLQVRGAGRDAAGTRVHRALRDDPRVRPVLDAHGEPDTVEIGRDRRVVLTYRHGRDGRTRRVVVEPRGGVRNARAARGGVARAPARPEPSTQQGLECPIDPARPDCRALCAAGARWEWCR